MGLPEAKQSLTDAFLEHVPVLESDGWHSRARNAARSRLQSSGIPVWRDEYWRFTKPDGFTDVDPSFTTKSDGSDIFAKAAALTLTFVDGVFDPAQSDDLELGEATVALLSEAGQLDIHWSQDLFGTLEAAAQTPVERPLAAITTCLASDGVLIHVTGQAAKPIRLRYLSGGGQANIHHVIKLDKGAALTVLEEGLPAARSGVNMEVEVGDGATFNHIRTQGPEDDRQSLTGIFARLGTESTFKSFTLLGGGQLSRNEAYIEMNGDNSSACIAGAAIGRDDFHNDDTVFVTHDAVDCESRQVFKKVLRNGATGVFQGKILVKPDAQKTDGYQISQGLLLDDESEFLAKPELEIYADDVACSHGSTVGAVDEDALFYLTSRGVPKAEAQNMLVLAFLAEAIEEIDDEALGEIVTDRLAVWMDQRS